MAKRMLPHLSALLMGLALVFSATQVVAQDGDPGDNGGPDNSESSEQNLPHYLKPTSDAADLQLLYAVFGDVARAAAGQITLSDIMMSPEDATNKEAAMNTDSVIAAIMHVYLIGIAGATLIALVGLIILMMVQAGIEGKVFTERYNEWAVIRTIYAIFCILPLVGGWSPGQYAVLKASFFVNSIANEMHVIGNRFVYSRGTASSVQLAPREYRRIAETAFLNEICAVVVNREVEKDIRYLQAEVEESELRLEWPMSERARTNEELRKAHNEAALQSYTDRYIVQRRAEDASGQSSLRGAINTGSTFVNNATSAPTLTLNRENQLYKRYVWGSGETTPDSCGSVTVDFGQFATADGEASTSAGMPDRTLRAFYSAHDTAMENMLDNIHKDVQAVNDLIKQIEQGVIPTSTGETSEATDLAAIDGSKEARMAAYQAYIEAEGEEGELAALAGLVDDLGTVAVNTLDDLYMRHANEYIRQVRETYNQETAKQAEAFDELLREVQRRQAMGGGPSYTDAFERGLEGADLPPQLEDLADGATHSLIENSRKGWLYTGYKWWDVGRAMANGEALAQHIPTHTPYHTQLRHHAPAVAEALEQFDLRYTRAVTLRGLIAEKNDASGEGPPSKADTLDRLENVFQNSGEDEADKQSKGVIHRMVVGGLFKFVFSGLKDGDPLTAIQRGGHRLLTASATMHSIAGGAVILAVTTETGGGWAAKLVTLGGSGIKGQIIGALLRGLAKTLTNISMIFLIVGLIYAVYLPLMPAMIWTFGVIGWLEKLVGLICILPIWMAGHIIPDGGGIMNGVARQGYALTANVLFRPPIMVLAIHFSMFALGAMTQYLVDFVDIFIPSAHANYTAGLYVSLGSFIVFSGFLVVVTHAILNWCYRIPDDLPHYIGGPPGGFGEGESRGQMHAVAGMMMMRSEGAAAQMMPGGGDPNQRRGMMPSGGGGAGEAGGAGGAGQRKPLRSAKNSFKGR